MDRETKIKLACLHADLSNLPREYQFRVYIEISFELFKKLYVDEERQAGMLFGYPSEMNARLHDDYRLVIKHMKAEGE